MNTYFIIDTMGLRHATVKADSIEKAYEMAGYNQTAVLAIPESHAEVFLDQIKQSLTL